MATPPTGSPAPRSWRDAAKAGGKGHPKPSRRRTFFWLAAAFLAVAGLFVVVITRIKPPPPRPDFVPLFITETTSTGIYLPVNGQARDFQNVDMERRRQKAMADGRIQSVEDYRAFIRQYPPLRTANAAWRNRGDLTFEETSRAWGFDRQGISQGMAVADLDNYRRRVQKEAEQDRRFAALPLARDLLPALARATVGVRTNSTSASWARFRSPRTGRSCRSGARSSELSSRCSCSIRTRSCRPTASSTSCGGTETDPA